MTRLTISLPDALYNRLSALAIQHNESMSNIINKLIQVGAHHWYTNQDSNNVISNNNTIPNDMVEQHCQQLIIQMNALIKNLSEELLKFNQEDFTQLHKAALNKYNELKNVNTHLV